MFLNSFLLDLLSFPPDTPELAPESYARLSEEEPGMVYQKSLVHTCSHLPRR